MAAIKNEVTLASREILKATNGQLSERIAGRFKVIIEQAEMLTLLFKRLTPFSGRRADGQFRQPSSNLLRTALACMLNALKN